MTSQAGGVWVVFGETGQYSDRSVFPLASFPDSGSAEEWAANVRVLVRAFWTEWDLLDVLHPVLGAWGATTMLAEDWFTEEAEVAAQEAAKRLHQRFPVDTRLLVDEHCWKVSVEHVPAGMPVVSVGPNCEDRR